jgi:hypothetical protein
MLRYTYIACLLNFNEEHILCFYNYLTRLPLNITILLYRNILLKISYMFRPKRAIIRLYIKYESSVSYVFM